MVHGDVLEADGIASASREYVDFVDTGREIEIGEVITAADLVASAGVVDFGHELVFRLLNGEAGEGDLSIGAVWQGDETEEVAGNGVKAAGGNEIAGNGLAGDGIDKLAGTEGGEVTPALFGGGDETDLAGWRVAEASALKGTEKEELVLEDGAAEGTAELIALERVLDRSEELAGIHGSVAKEVKP